MSSFIMLISLLAFSFFSNIQADLIDDICSQAVNPTLCNDSLRSDPRSRATDLRTLGKISVDQSISTTSSTVDVANSLANGSIKQKAQACADSCNDAVGILKQVGDLLSGGGRSDNLPTKAIAAFSDIAVCESEFGRELPPQLKEAVYRALGLVDVVSVIVKRL